MGDCWGCDALRVSSDALSRMRKPGACSPPSLPMTPDLQPGFHSLCQWEVLLINASQSY